MPSAGFFSFAEPLLFPLCLSFVSISSRGARGLAVHKRASHPRAGTSKLEATILAVFVQATTANSLVLGPPTASSPNNELLLGHHDEGVL